MSLPEIHWLGGHEDMHPMRRVDHYGATISAMRAAGVSPANRIVTSPLRRSIVVTGTGGVGAAIAGTASLTGVKTAFLSAGKTNLPSRALRLQSDMRVGRKPCLAATAFTVIPFTSVSATIRAFKCFGQRLRPEKLSKSLQCSP